MAAAPTLPLVPVEEYLNTSYRPDVDYVDGALVERGLPTVAHGLLQILLGRWFARYEKEFNFRALSEVRTQIIEGARYRVPDVMLCPTPLSRAKAVTTVPLAIIEILSPTDKMFDMLERFRDYASVGVHSIVLMDPERSVSHKYENGSLMQTGLDALELPGGANVPFSTTTIFGDLHDALDEPT
jgi:Uma2 family endonuclease